MVSECTDWKRPLRPVARSPPKGNRESRAFLFHPTGLSTPDPIGASGLPRVFLFDEEGKHKFDCFSTQKRKCLLVRGNCFKHHHKAEEAGSSLSTETVEWAEKERQRNENNFPEVSLSMTRVESYGGYVISMHSLRTANMIQHLPRIQDPTHLYRAFCHTVCALFRLCFARVYIPFLARLCLRR